MKIPSYNLYNYRTSYVFMILLFLFATKLNSLKAGPMSALLLHCQFLLQYHMMGFDFYLKDN